MATAFTLTRERIADKALEKCGAIGADTVPGSADRALSLEALDLLLKELPIYGYSWPKTAGISTDFTLNDHVADVAFPSDYYGNAFFEKVGEAGGQTNFTLLRLPEWHRLERYDGGDKVTNGQFTSNITGWTDDSVGDGSITHNATLGALNLIQGTIAANFARATQSMTVTVDALHELKVKVSKFDIKVRIGTTSGASDILADTTLFAGDQKLFFPSTPQGRVVFFPTVSPVFVQYESAGDPTDTSIIDDVTLFTFEHGDSRFGYIDPDDRLHVHPIADRDIVLRLRYQRIIDDTVGGQPPDIDEPWILGLAYGIAAEIGDEFGVPDQKLARFQARWVTARGRGLIANVDQGKLIVEVDDGEPPVATTPTGEQPFAH